MPFFSTFITLHLGKGHTVFRPSTGILAQMASATASLFSGVDSNRLDMPNVTATRDQHSPFKNRRTFDKPLLI